MPSGGAVRHWEQRVAMVSTPLPWENHVATKDIVTCFRLISTPSFKDDAYSKLISISLCNGVTCFKLVSIAAGYGVNKRGRILN